MRNTMILLIGTLALLPATLGAQQEGNAGADTRIEAAMEAAVEAQIPASLLESKVLEGRAKGVAGSRIAAAVESRLTALLRAQETMRRAELETATEGELAITADALEVGVSDEALITIHARAPEERRLVATAVLGALVQLGLASDRALDRVNAALQGGPAALANLRSEVVAGMRAQGLVPAVGIGVQAGGLIRIPK